MCMTMEIGPTLDVESLEQICFERSKKWSNLFENILLRDDGEELNINDFDEIFEKNDEDDYDDESEAEYVANDVVLEESTNYDMDHYKTRVEGNQKPQHKYDLPLVKANDDSHNVEEIDKTEMENIVDETLPLLVEHKRRWEENGLERVLESFDADKIERKVGSWLRRNNSVFSQNNKTVCYNAPSHNHSKQSMASRVSQQCRYKHHHKKNEDPLTYSSDAESMHSVDTARYIKSSRRHVEPQGSFSSFCTKTTIKTYRMVKSKRDELREKYGCPEYDEEHSHRIQKMRHRRQQNHRQHDYNVALCQRKYPLDGHHMSSSQRRKHLIKRRSNLDMSVTSSEDDECEECIVVCNRPNRPIVKSPRCCPSVQRTRHRSDQMHHHHHLDRTSSSCSCTSKHHGAQYVERSKSMNIKCKQRDLFFEDDRRPYRRETDCSCCNETKLCKSVRHLANSSTEDWLVENGDLDESIKVVPSKSNHRKSLKEKDKLNSTDKKMGAVGGGNGNGNRHVTFTQENNQSAMKTATPRNYPISAKSLRERKSNNCYVFDSSHDSDDSYKPVKKKSIMKTTNEVKSKRIHPPPAPASESKSKSARKKSTSLDKIKEKQIMIPDKLATQQKDNKKSTNDKCVEVLKNDATNYEEPSDIFKDDLKQAIKISKMTYKQDMKRLSEEKEKKENCKKPTKQQKETFEKSLTLMMEASIATGGESSFFSSKHDICNSTELDNNAKKMDLKHITMKHEAAVSTTHHQGGGGGAGANNSSSSSSFGSNTIISKPKAAKRTMTMEHPNTLRIINDLDDVDCTIVSSTTDADAAPQQMQRNETKLVTPSQTSTHLVPPITDKGILLYAPNARDIVPSNSFHNGYFTITEEHLSGIIGKEAAQKFLKYYIGRRRFRPNSTIYFKPPPKNSFYRSAASSTTLGGGTEPLLHVSRCGYDSHSDDDIFDKMGRYGHIYESFEK